MSDVLVTGAGPTGLTLACLLQRQGIDVRVVDRLAGPADVTKAMVLWSRSLEVLEEIGIAHEVDAAGGRLEHARYLAGGTELATVRTDVVPGTRWQPVILPQNMLERLLRDRLTALGGHIEWGTQVTALRPGPHDVTATVRTARGTHELAADYVVGCDGLRSVVREAAGIEWTEGAPYEETFMLADLTAATALDRTTVHHFLGRHGVCVAAPLPGDRWRVAGYLDGETPPEQPAAEDLQRLLRACDDTELEVTEILWSGVFRVVRRLAERFRAGRILLAGDAAHVHSPAGGQGLNTGIQDAHNLAWKLDLVVRGQAESDLLDTYGDERRPVADTILTRTELQDTRLFGARSTAARTARDTVLRTVGRSGLLERTLIPDLAQVRVSFKQSRLSAGRARPGSQYRPGRLAPDVVFLRAGDTRPVRLRAVAASGLALIAVPGSERAPLEELERVAALHGIALHRSSGPLPDRVSPGKDGMLIGLRPDGYVGYRGPCAITPELWSWLRDGVGLRTTTPAKPSVSLTIAA